VAASDTKKQVNAGKAESGQRGRESAAHGGDAALQEQAPRPVRSGAKTPRAAASRGPVRKGSDPRTGANKKTSGANKKTSGANKKASSTDSDSDKSSDEDESKSEEQRDESKFWQGLVSAAYRSRRARGDWPKD